MSGETEGDVSGWTVDTSRADVLARLVALERLHASQRIDDKEAVEKALAAAEKAVDKALASLDKRLEGMNEFRDTLRDQAGTFMPRSESTARWQSVTDQVAELKARMDAAAGEDLGGHQVRTALIAVAGVIVAALALATTVILALN